MPRLRNDLDGLPPVLLGWLATGDLPDADAHHGFGGGMLDAFILAGRWQTYQMRASQPDVDSRVLDELGALWNEHKAQIVRATPAGDTPWVLTALRATETVSDDLSRPEGRPRRSGRSRRRR